MQHHTSAVLPKEKDGSREKDRGIDSLVITIILKFAVQYFDSIMLLCLEGLHCAL